MERRSAVPKTLGPWNADGRLSRTSIAVADQALSSLSNVGIALLVAHFANARFLGVFGISLAIYGVVLALGRSGLSYVVITRELGQSHDEASIAALCLGALAGLIVSILSLESGYRLPLLAFALAMPIIALQDFCRVIEIARGRPQLALFSDALWLGSFIGLCIVLHQGGWLGVTTAVFSWMTAAVIAFLPFRLPAPVFLGSARWVRRNLRVTGSYLGDTLMQWGSFNAGALMLGTVGGLVAIGELRATLILFSPLNVLVALVPALVLPRVRHWDATDSLRRNLVGVSSAIIIANFALAFAIHTRVTPNSLATPIFGHAWTLGKRFVFPVALYNTATAVNLAFVLVMRSRNATTVVVRARAVAGVLELSCGIIGLFIAKSSGLLFGLATGQMIALWGWSRWLPRRPARVDSDD